MIWGQRGMLKNKRIIYAILFFVLLVIEVIIALFIKDRFIRPYVGDLLVTVLLCAFSRIFIPNKIKFLPIFVFLFSVIVEFAQYVDIVKLLRLEHIEILSVLVGRSFSVIDIICYALGCIIFFVLECFLINKRHISKSK